MKVSQLVSVDQATGELAVGKDAVAFLNSLTGRVGLTSIAGNYRTGKSWLLNQLCDVPPGADQGFGVGPSVQRHTLGLWIAQHTRSYTDPDDGQPFRMLFMDMEGLCATEATEQHDVRMFAMGLLLSSFFVYNSRGAIDEEAISKLARVADISQHIRMSAASSSSSSSSPDDDGAAPAVDDDSSIGNVQPQAEDGGGGSAMPEFLWLLRDFALELKNSAGQTISADQYLEHTLTSQGSGHLDEDKRAMRQRLCSLLPKRHAAMLPRPAVNEEDLQHLHKLPPSKYRPVFREHLAKLRKMMDDHSRVKRTPQGTPVSGAMLARFVQELVAAFNSGKTPAIRNQWAMMADLVCRQASEKAAVEWAQLDQQLKTAVSAQKLDTLIEATRTRSIDVFEAATQTTGNTAEIARFRRKLEIAMDRQEQNYRQHNAANVSTQLRALLDAHEGELAACDGVQTLKARMAQVEEEVRAQFGASPDITQAFAGLVQSRIWTWLLTSSQRVNDKLERVSERHDELKQQNIDLTKQMSSVQSELVATSGAHLAIQAAYDANQLQLGEAQHELETLRDTHAALAAELTALQTQYESQTAQSTEALFKATEAANDRVAAADEARSQSSLELEQTQQQLDAETKRSKSVVEELSEATARLATMEEEVSALHECRLRLRESEEQVSALQRNHDELQQHMSAKLLGIQQTADASIANATRQSNERAKRADAELVHTASDLERTKQALEQGTREWGDRSATLTHAADQARQSAEKWKSECETARQQAAKALALVSEHETKLRAEQEQARSQLNEVREKHRAELAQERDQHRLELGRERDQATVKIGVAEVARTEAIQTQLAQQMAAAEKDREKSSRLAVAESRLGELKRVREECDVLEANCKRQRGELDTSERALNRATGERDALKNSQDRQHQELAQAREQIGKLQRAATDRQFQHATDLYNANARGGGGVGTTASASSPPPVIT